MATDFVTALTQARQAGHSDDDILSALAQKRPDIAPRIQAGLSDGHSASDLLEAMGKRAMAQYVPNASATMQSELKGKQDTLLNRIATYNPNWQQSQSQKDLDTSANRQSETGFLNNFHPWQAVTKPIPQWVNHMNNPYQTATAPGGGVEDIPFATAAVKAGTQLADGDIAGAAGSSGDAAVQALATAGALKYGPKYTGRVIANTPAVMKSGARMVGKSALEKGVGFGLAGDLAMTAFGHPDAGAVGAAGAVARFGYNAVKNGTAGEFWGSMKNLFAKPTRSEILASNAQRKPVWYNPDPEEPATREPQSSGGGPWTPPEETNAEWAPDPGGQIAEGYRQPPARDWSKLGPAKAAYNQRPDFSSWGSLRGGAAPNELLQNIADNSAPAQAEPAPTPAEPTPAQPAPNELLQNIVDKSRPTLPSGRTPGGIANQTPAAATETTQAASPSQSGPVTPTALLQQVQDIVATGKGTPQQLAELQEAVNNQDLGAVQSAVDKIHGINKNHQVYKRTGKYTSKKAGYIGDYLQQNPDVDIRDYLAKTQAVDEFIQQRGINEDSLSDQLKIIRKERPDLATLWDEVHAFGKDITDYYAKKGLKVNKTNRWEGIGHDTLNEAYEGLTGKRWNK